jgi:hypothetical protein
LGGTHREVGHDDTGDDNESSFHDFSREESKSKLPPLKGKEMPLEGW